MWGSCYFSVCMPIIYVIWGRDLTHGTFAVTEKREIKQLSLLAKRGRV